MHFFTTTAKVVYCLATTTSVLLVALRFLIPAHASFAAEGAPGEHESAEAPAAAVEFQPRQPSDALKPTLFVSPGKVDVPVPPAPRDALFSRRGVFNLAPRSPAAGGFRGASLPTLKLEAQDVAMRSMGQGPASGSARYRRATTSEQLQKMPASWQQAAGMITPFMMEFEARRGTPVAHQSRRSSEWKSKRPPPWSSGGRLRGHRAAGTNFIPGKLVLSTIEE